MLYTVKKKHLARNRPMFTRHEDDYVSNQLLKILHDLPSVE